MFYSPSCPYCQQMEPYFFDYSKEFKDKVVFARVNILNSQTAVSRYGIMGSPTFKFFCKGHPVQELSGAVYPSLLKKMVEESLKNSSDCVKNTTWIDTSIAGYA